MDQLWLWVGFNAFVLAMLALDLGVFHRSAHEVSIREAAAWSAVWVALALGFGGGIYRFMGEQAGLEFLAGYLIEKALSVDNIFVFVLIFSYFRVPPKYQHRVLFWGILGALVMRGVMIGLGAYLIHHFEWILYVFGAFLIWTGYPDGDAGRARHRAGSQPGDPPGAPVHAGERHATTARASSPASPPGPTAGRGGWPPRCSSSSCWSRPPT